MQKNKISQLSSEELVLWERWKYLMKEQEGIDWADDTMPFGFYCWMNRPNLITPLSSNGRTGDFGSPN